MTSTHVTHTMPRRRYAQQTFNAVQAAYSDRIQPTFLERCSSVVGSGSYWLVVLLALRGILVFMSAGHSNRLVSVLGFFTGPFVAPFRVMFSYDTSVFEVFTAVAMIAYALIGWLAVQVLRAVQAANNDKYWERE